MSSNQSTSITKSAPRQKDGSERRVHARFSSDAPVLLWYKGFPENSSWGRLIDISEGGFRAAHAGFFVKSGDYVVFETNGKPGLARVVWTRANGAERESGFLILPTPAQ
jgi:hypothetical protein